MKKIWLPFVTVFIVGATLSMHAASSAATLPELKAVASDVIPGPLIVDEKNLTKLNEIVVNRMGLKSKDFQVRYKVTFVNNFYYETEELPILLGEENTSVRQIQSVELTARVVPNVRYSRPLTPEQRLKLEEALLDLQSREVAKIEISLSGRGAAYLISGGDRDWVLSAQVDISERLQIIAGSGRIARLVIAPATAIIALIIVFALLANRFRKAYDNRMRSQDSDHKTTPLYRYIFALQDPGLSFAIVPSTIMISIVSASICFVGARWLINYLYPETLFLIGDQIQAFESLKNIRTYILTGIVATFVIGFIANLVANMVTKRN